MAERFPISFNRFMRVLSIPLGIGPRRSDVTVHDRSVTVRMGWAFHATIDRSSIGEVVPYEGRITAWGAHGWRGRWLVNGSSDGVVVLRFDPPQQARVLMFPIRRLRELAVSVENAEQFVAALGH